MTLISGIVAYYKFDGSSADATGNGFNGSDTNVTYTSGAGKINQGAHFLNTSGNNIGIGSSSSLNLSTFSIATWIKTGWTGSTRDTIYSRADTWATGRGLSLNCSDANSLACLMGGSFANKTIISNLSTYLTANTWHHLVVTYDGTTLIGYIDGVARGSVASGYNSAPTDNSMIGLRGDFTDYWKGDMDEFGIWNRALASSEVTALYNAAAGIQYPFAANANPAFLLNFV